MKFTNSAIKQGEKFEYDFDGFQAKLEATLGLVFPKKTKEYIHAFCEYVMKTDAAFIKDETIQKHHSFCEQCGVCCLDIGCSKLLMNGKCGIWNQKYRRNNEWKDKKPKICHLWPGYSASGDRGVNFVLGCPYAFRVVLHECVRVMSKGEKI